MSVTPEQIKRIVQSEDDFGHEMRVGRILRAYRESLQRRRKGDHKMRKTEKGQSVKSRKSLSRA
jgi:hypothetical protein